MENGWALGKEDILGMENGCAIGKEDGCALGIEDGCALGKEDGCALGNELGKEDGASDGDELGASAGDWRTGRCAWRIGWRCAWCIERRQTGDAMAPRPSANKDKCANRDKDKMQQARLAPITRADPASSIVAKRFLKMEL